VGKPSIGDLFAILGAAFVDVAVWNLAGGWWALLFVGGSLVACGALMNRSGA
jgi:hypothetical protein